MPDETPTTDQTPGTEEGAETPPEGPTEVEGADTSGTPPEGAEGDSEASSEEPAEDTELTIEGAKKALSKVRKENGDWRTKYRALEAQVAEAKTPEQVAEIESKTRSESATEMRNLLAENVALKTGLPEAFAGRLVGTTREELEADAATLAQLIPATAKQEPADDPDLNGGLSGSSGSGDNVDVEAEVRKIRAGRY